MLRPVQHLPRKPNSGLPRRFHAASTRNVQALRQKQPPASSPARSLPNYKYRDDEEQKVSAKSKEEIDSLRFVKRNPVGVQMLSRSLHEQIFANCSFPPPSNAYTNISISHLSAHGLDPKQSSTLPSTEFTLPPLQGDNLLQHFHRIGSSSSEPFLSLAKSFCLSNLPPRPENFDIQAGWTKYYHAEDGSGHCEHVEYPIHDGKPEQLLCFDVETMPKYHQYPVMACAASPNGWYAWISPWLLDPSSTTPEQLVPLGPLDVPRAVVGHNVSYDRARVQEEYHLDGTMNRFFDTMALHVAIKGISSHQRPAWNKYRKQKDDEVERKRESVEAIVHLMRDVQTQLTEGVGDEHASQLKDLLADLEESLPKLQASLSLSEGAVGDVAPPDFAGEDSIEASQKRWEDITSANSLVDVAKLHCDIDISKEIRNDFMTASPEEILSNISDYLSYCASDVDVTHQVYKKVLPEFLKACPHPVSFAGVAAMGSGFLPVNQEWETYLDRAEGVYMKMEREVRDNLANLARDAMEMNQGKDSEEIDDPWLRQLDWTPKTANASRGVTSTTIQPVDVSTRSSSFLYASLMIRKTSRLRRSLLHRMYPTPPTLPLLLRLSYGGHPLVFTAAERWHYVDSGVITRLPTARGKTHAILSPGHVGKLLKEEPSLLDSCDKDLASTLSAGNRDDAVKDALLNLARKTLEDSLHSGMDQINTDPWISQLAWETVPSTSTPKRAKVSKPKLQWPQWPKWFWELTKPKKDIPPGSLDITIRNRVAPLLLKLSWYDYPLFHSREHGWIFRVPSDLSPSSPHAEKFKRLTSLNFYDAADDALADAVLRGGYVFYKLPHKDGEKANVGSPLGKTFMKFAVEGVLRSGAGDKANKIVDVGAQCSYWVSARDRILNQMVGWQKEGRDMGFPEEAGDTPKKWGITLPQVITMGTVTRRAIEKTWLTASNAKKNRVGSELKAMVRAPPGYAIVGADVDSEELWISSCMGDAQFGFHGASAIGWMTLEGTKSAGTDLHSKTANILGISRDQAKVFNYSRIYGAGMRHAVLLLLQGSSGMLPEEAQKLAENLYASTKGKNTHRTDIFERKFWYGGTESYLFNKLEEIAISEKPQTPALGCGITSALTKEYLPSNFGSDYMPSRINWVVQSSGVDYLHLLIVSMDHLIKKYDIKARYLISVHDELRYLVREEDKYRAALALQIANLWTRSMFAYKLGMDDLPQGVAFFSAVDVDHVLRKEVDMPCVTPSQPNPIPPGESLDIAKILALTNGGSLWKNDRPMLRERPETYEGSLEGYIEPDCLTHRSYNAEFLRAQGSSDFGEIKHLARKAYGKEFTGGPGGNQKRQRQAKKGLGNGEGVDWASTVDRLLQSGKDLNLS